MADDKELRPAHVPKRQQSIFQPIYDSQIWQSIFRHGWMNNDRNRALVILTNVFMHMHPVRIRKSGVMLSYTWCMGGLSFFLFVFQNPNPYEHMRFEEACWSSRGRPSWQPFIYIRKK